jgi:4-aminobutyrate aminotransferase-like enzyme
MQGRSDVSVSQVSEASSISPNLQTTKHLIVSRADGCWLIDRQGERYFDCSAGSGAVNLGHQHPQVVAAITRQAAQLVHTGWNLQSDIRTEAVQRLGAFSPYDNCGVLLTVTGAEGVEAGIKVARAYTGRKFLIAFEHSYHGKTAGSLAVTWRESFRQFIADSGTTIFTPFPLLHLEDESYGTEACLKELERVVEMLESAGEPPAAIVIEPIQGSEGVLPADPGFLRDVIKLGKRVGCLTVYDEIYTGFGRCGFPFYGSREGLTPDLMVVGKALGNGLPISAVLGPTQIMEALPPGHHTSTFSGNPLSCAAACAVLEVTQKEETWRLADWAGVQIREGLLGLSQDYAFISKPRGEGLMLAFDLLDSSGNPSPRLAEQFAEEVLRQKIIVRYGGFHGSAVKITPPLLMSVSELEFLMEGLRRAAQAIANNALR